jgi:prevent-host-death family protein
MKIVTAKELRVKASAVLEEAKKGNEVMVTLRGKPVAILKPLSNERRVFKRIGFGIWKDRKDMRNPRLWVSEKRSERKSPAHTF